MELNNWIKMNTMKMGDKQFNKELIPHCPRCIIPHCDKNKLYTILVKGTTTTQSYIINEEAIAKSSPVFAVMAKIQDTAFNQTRNIEIKDVKLNTMDIVMTHIYGREINFDNIELDGIFGLINVADRYCIMNLTEICYEYITEKYINIRMKDVNDLIKIMAFADADIHRSYILRFCETFLQNTFLNAKSSDDLEYVAKLIVAFENCSVDNLKEQYKKIFLQYFNGKNCAWFMINLSKFPPSTQTCLEQICMPVLEKNPELYLSVGGDTQLLQLDIPENIMLNIFEEEKFTVMTNELDIINFVERWIKKKTSYDSITLPMFQKLINNNDIIKTILPKLRILMLSKVNFLTNSFLISLLSSKERDIIGKAIDNGCITSEFPSHLSPLTKRIAHTNDIINDENKNSDKYNALNENLINVGLSDLLFKNRVKSCKFSFRIQGQSFNLTGFSIFAPSHGLGDIEHSQSGLDSVEAIKRRIMDFSVNVIIKNEFYSIHNEKYNIYPRNDMLHRLEINGNILVASDVQYDVTLIFDDNYPFVSYTEYKNQIKFADDTNTIIIKGDLGPIRDFIYRIIL